MASKASRNNLIMDVTLTLQEVMMKAEPRAEDIVVVACDKDLRLSQQSETKYFFRPEVSLVCMSNVQMMNGLF